MCMKIRDGDLEGAIPKSMSFSIFITYNSITGVTINDGKCVYKSPVQFITTVSVYVLEHIDVGSS